MPWRHLAHTDHARRPEVVPSARAAYAFLFLLLVGCSASRETTHALDSLLSPPAWPATAVEGAPALDTQALAQRIQELVNQARMDHGLPPLHWAQRLADVAVDHSRDMARHPFFGHTNPRGQEPGDRVRNAGLPETLGREGYFIQCIGENLFLTHRYAEYRVNWEQNGVARFEFEWKAYNDIAREPVHASVAGKPVAPG